MVVFYSSLHTGGIETFFLRLCKERSENGLLTTFILTDIEASDKYLLNEINKYANIYSLSDFLPSVIEKLYVKVKYVRYLYLLSPFLIKESLSDVLEKNSVIHVTSPLYVMLALKTLKAFGLKKKITYGIYHSETFSPKNKKTRYHYYRKLLEQCYKLIPDKNVIFFNDHLLEIYKKKHKIYHAVKNVFPLGVIDDVKNVSLDKVYSNRYETLRICSVGRIVDFKTYNFWMPRVIEELNEKGFNIEYHIYGDGKDKNKLLKIIEENNLTHTKVKNSFEYRQFANIVSKYDMFIGSGTAIIEAASLGIPSIIGIERIKEPKTYGFISEIPGYTYNEDGLYEKILIKDRIIDFLSMSEVERKQLIKKHLEKAKLFSIENCSSNFERVNNNAEIVKPSIELNSVKFATSYLYSLYINSRAKN